MTEIGLFPLGAVLLPSERMPLHIFEPRYQELIGECLEDDREFGLVLADDDGVRQVGTRASVVDVLDRFDDGRLNIVIEGGERFRVVELTSGRSFQTGAVETLEDVAADPKGDEVELVLERFKRLAELADAAVDDLDTGSRCLSFELASRVDFGPELKQELLELRSEPERLRLLSELLERAFEALSLERTRRERAAQNGRVSTD